MSAKRATISDIATAAGVSKTTVSRYINGRFDLLSESARTRVEKAIQLANYRPNAAARSLKTQRSYLVGVIVANITTPFATSLLNGISQGLRDAGYVPMFADAADSPETEHTLVGSLVSHQVDGLIVNTTCAENPELIGLANSGTPVVLVDRFVNDYNFDIVTTPYREPTLELMRHLHDEGYGRAVIVTQDYENNSPRSSRVDAFIEGDRALFGAAEPERDIYLANPWEHGQTTEVVRRVLEETAEGPVAIYANNTVTLIAVSNALEELGIAVPTQVGLCGPDDWGWAHRMGWDWTRSLAGGVTTFETDPYEMGFEAARLMLDRIAEPGGKKQHRLVSTSLHVRSSTQLLAALAEDNEATQ